VFSELATRSGCTWVGFGFPVCQIANFFKLLPELAQRWLKYSITKGNRIDFLISLFKKDVIFIYISHYQRVDDLPIVLKEKCKILHVGWVWISDLSERQLVQTFARVGAKLV
jgi:hypothetical protein